MTDFNKCLLRCDKVKHDEIICNEIQKWMVRMFTSFVVHERAFKLGYENAVNYRFELLFDIDEYLEIHHSLDNYHSIGVVDVMLFSYIRRATGINAQ